MSDLEHDGPELGRIHKRSNDRKFFCHFTGFLEGIAASGHLEKGEIEPLIAECEEFVMRVADEDATDLVQDLEADLLEHDVITDVVEVRLDQIDPDCNNSSLNRFLGFCRGVVCDGIITIDEALSIQKRIENEPDLLGVVGVRQIYISSVDAVEDGVISPEESDAICEAIGHIVGDCYGDTGLAQTTGTANYLETRLQDLEVDLDGKTIVLTGTFQSKPRSNFERQIEEFGANIVKHVSGKTDFLIVGGEASRDWIELNRGTKIRKAQELRLNSDKPDFVSELQLLRLISERRSS